jgi:hypothetical protein
VGGVLAPSPWLPFGPGLLFVPGRLRRRPPRRPPRRPCGARTLPGSPGRRAAARRRGARGRAQAAEGAGAGAGAGGLPAGAQVTLGFNRARIREAAAQPTAAAAEYRGILAAVPGYTDARLRCAALARARGDLEAAVAEAQARPQKDDDHAVVVLKKESPVTAKKKVSSAPGPGAVPAGPEPIPGARSDCHAPLAASWAQRGRLATLGRANRVTPLGVFMGLTVV